MIILSLVLLFTAGYSQTCQGDEFPTSGVTFADASVRSDPGPDLEDANIGVYYYNVGSVDGRQIDLHLTSTSGGSVNDKSIVIDGDFGRVNMGSGNIPAVFSYIYNDDSTPVNLDILYMTFLDLDGTQNGAEVVRAYGSISSVPSTADLNIPITGGGTAETRLTITDAINSQNEPYVQAKNYRGSGACCENPTNINDLDTKQKRLSITYKWENVVDGIIRMEFQVSNAVSGSRNINFAGVSFSMLNLCLTCGQATAGFRDGSPMVDCGEDVVDNEDTMCYDGITDTCGTNENNVCICRTKPTTADPTQEPTQEPTEEATTASSDFCSMGTCDTCNEFATSVISFVEGGETVTLWLSFDDPWNAVEIECRWNPDTESCDQYWDPPNGISYFGNGCQYYEQEDDYVISNVDTINRSWKVSEVRLYNDADCTDDITSEMEISTDAYTEPNEQSFMTDVDCDTFWQNSPDTVWMPYTAKIKINGDLTVRCARVAQPDDAGDDHTTSQFRIRSKDGTLGLVKDTESCIVIDATDMPTLEPTAYPTLAPDTLEIKWYHQLVKDMVKCNSATTWKDMTSDQKEYRIPREQALVYGGTDDNYQYMSCRKLGYCIPHTDCPEVDRVDPTQFEWKLYRFVQHTCGDGICQAEETTRSCALDCSGCEDWCDVSNNPNRCNWKKCRSCDCG